MKWKPQLSLFCTNDTMRVVTRIYETDKFFLLTTYYTRRNVLYEQRKASRTILICLALNISALFRYLKINRKQSFFSVRKQCKRNPNIDGNAIVLKLKFQSPNDNKLPKDVLVLFNKSASLHFILFRRDFPKWSWYLQYRKNWASHTISWHYITCLL